MGPTGQWQLALSLTHNIVSVHCAAPMPSCQATHADDASGAPPPPTLADVDHQLAPFSPSSPSLDSISDPTEPTPVLILCSSTTCCHALLLVATA
jgi:hypothetical protein